MLDKELFKLPGIKRIFSALIVLAIIQALAIIAQANFLAQALVQTWRLRSITALYLPMLLFFISFALRHVINWFENWLIDRYASSTSEALKKQLLHKMLELGPRLTQSNGSGNMITMGTEGINQVNNYFNLIFSKMINMMILPWLMLIDVFYLNWISGLILLLVFPIVILFMIILGYAAQAKAESQYAGFQALANHFVDAMRGLSTLKVFGLSEKYSDNIYDVSESYRKSTMSVLKIALLSSFALDFFTTLSIAVVAVFLGMGLINGAITLLPALTILILAPEYFLPLRDFGNDYHATLNGKNAYHAIMEVLNQPTVKNDHELKNFTWQATSHLSVRDLDFSYDQKNDALKDIAFELKGHQKVGIVGESGSGKSTLLNLLGGFLQPTDQNAEFKVDDQQLSNLTQTDWQRQFSYLPQTPYIYAMTIAENIAFYQPEASPEAIKTAAKRAGLLNFIDQLPDGFDTKIGEGGRGISGGQAQRIALARALVDQNRRLMLLDEPTAHLDIETEYELKETMLPNFADHLVLFATHRLHWMKDMDYILMLDHGRLVEQGTPSELLANNGAYAKMVKEIRGEA